MTYSLSRRALMGGSLALAASAGPANAAFPERPISLVVGFAPGGTSDVAARIMAEHMGASLGQRLVVENRPGASATTAAEFVRGVAPDGHTIMVADPSSHAIGPVLLRNVVRYDPTSDFTCLGRIGEGPLVVVVPAASPYRSLNDLIADIRTNPGRRFYASSGLGAITHLGAAMLLRAAGRLEAEHVPYRGGAPMMEALVKGEAAFGVAVLASAVPLIRGGAVRALAIAGPARSTSAPDIPTAPEQGLSGFALATWLVLLGPRGIPAPIALVYERAITAALRDTAVRERLLNAGIEAATPGSAEDCRRFLAAEVARFGAGISETGVRAE